MAGLATLLVEYLSYWGTEMEFLTVLLATFIIALLLDIEKILGHFWVDVLVATIVVLEFVIVFMIAIRRREIEQGLWNAVRELEEWEANIPKSLPDADTHRPGRQS